MEKLNLNFSGGSNIVKSICWIMSYLSWLMLVVSGWISLKWLEEKISITFDDIKYGNIIWTIIPYRKEIGWLEPLPVQTGHSSSYLDYYPYLPFQMHVALIYIVFIITLIVILGGCVVFLIKTTCKPDDQVKNGMMGDFSKFHFFPLLCTSALFIIGECIDEDIENEDHFKSMIYAGLVFSILALASFIFIYIMTDLNTQDWWVLLLLKKGTYSCLIVLVWYYFCYNIFYVHYASKDFYDDAEKLGDWMKGCGLAFSIIFGIGSLAFSFIFKDLVASCMNALIYVGLTVYYFKIHKDMRKEKPCNKNGDGIVDIIMIVLSVAVFVFLLIKHKDECLKS